MTTQLHTPGKWIVNIDSYKNISVGIDGGINTTFDPVCHIADENISDEEAMTYAKLIAKTPEQQAIIDELVGCLHAFIALCEDDDKYPVTCEMAQESINKAANAST